MSSADPPEGIWSLKFERGEASTTVNLQSIVAGIESLDADDPNNGYLVLSKDASDERCLGFAQTGLTDGYFVVEIRIDKSADDFGFWKAGAKQPVRAVVSQARDRCFQTFTNEALGKEEVKAIFEHFYRQFELHPDFAWRSIKEDLETRKAENSQPRMVIRRCTLDPWKSAKFVCQKCGKEWLGSDLPQGEMFSDGVERDCPECHEPVLYLAFEAVDELLEHWDELDPETQQEVARRSDFVNRWSAEKLKSPDQLPDLDGDEITLLWDEDSENQQTVIRFGDEVIWRQVLGYEHYEFFVDALEILKAKYGPGLVDVVPTEKAKLNLWGDRLSAPEICDEARRKLRTV